jgi:hypothetical protein
VQFCGLRVFPKNQPFMQDTDGPPSFSMRRSTALLLRRSPVLSSIAVRSSSIAGSYVRKT